MLVLSVGGDEFDATGDSDFKKNKKGKQLLCAYIECITLFVLRVLV